MSGAQATPPSGAGQQLKFVLILSRHGVRSPTKPNAQLDPYAAQPWPAWEVEPGELTPRGAQLLRLMGAYDRDRFVQGKLLPASGCPPPGAAYIWADTDHRTLGSATALADSMLPGCQATVHSLGDGVQDPLFHPLAAGIAPPDRAAALDQVRARLQGDATRSVTDNRAALDLLAHVLAPDPGHPPRKTLFDVPARLEAGTEDHVVSLLGPLATASTLSENLLLEYADGKPAAEVGWGRVDQPALQQLLGLHSAYFELIHRTPLLAQAEASNLLLHILDTLEQAATGKPLEGAIGPAGERLVVLAGHDTNLASLSALLGLHWMLDGRQDDTPPGTQLRFELWHDLHTGNDEVRMAVSMQTLAQLREAQLLSVANPPATQQLTLAGCTPCTLARFEALSRKALDMHYTVPAGEAASSR